MFTKHGHQAGHQALLKQRLNQLYNSPTSVKTNVEELKASLSFTQNDIDQRFSNIMKKYKVWQKKKGKQKRNLVLYKQQNYHGH